MLMTMAAPEYILHPTFPGMGDDASMTLLMPVEHSFLSLHTRENMQPDSHPSSVTTINRPNLYAPVQSTVSESAHPIDSGEPFCAVAGEQAMWRAVIVQALMDASCGSQKEEILQWKHDAVIWLRGNSKDFWTVAHYAGFDPVYLREMIAEALQDNCRWRAAPGEGVRQRPNRKRSDRQAGQRR